MTRKIEDVPGQFYPYLASEVPGWTKTIPDAHISIPAYYRTLTPPPTLSPGAPIEITGEKKAVAAVEAAIRAAAPKPLLCV